MDPLRVGVSADAVHIGVPGIPAVVHLMGIAKHPDQIVQMMQVGEAVIHQSPEGDERLGATLSPPEPGAVKLMERAPENGNVRIPQDGKGGGSRVQIIQKPLIEGCSGG